MIGLEHEFVVRSDTRVLDFRELIRGLPLGGRFLDPGDVNAQRCAWGGVITADGQEAEVAISPIPRRPGFVARLERSAVRARTALQRALPDGVDLAGYSTHLSFSMPAAINAAACRLFVSTFGPGLMLLADQTDSPGLLVRPRPGRMELAVEYVAGAQLQAVTAYAAGAAVATAAALRPNLYTPMPPEVRSRAVVTGDRYGWGVARDAYGDDLLRGGRGALLHRSSGGTISAQEHLELAWAAAKAAIGRGSTPSDLSAADEVVGRRAPLPIESLGSFGASLPLSAARSWTTPYGAILQPRSRPGFTATAEIATWDTTVFAIAGAWRRVFASVPRASLPHFLHSLDRGALDDTIRCFLDAPSSGRLLSSWTQAVQPGLFDAIAPGRLLLATELPSTVGTVAYADGARYGKTEVPPTYTTPRLPWWIWLLIGLLGLGGLIAFLLSRSSTPVPASATSSPGAAMGVPTLLAHLMAPSTIYVVEFPGGAPAGETYQWIGAIGCGTFSPFSRTPSAPRPGGSTATWTHPNAPLPPPDLSRTDADGDGVFDFCPHSEVPNFSHPGRITVIMSDGRGGDAYCTYDGSLDGTGQCRLGKP